MAGDFTPYSTAEKLITAAPAWVADEIEAQRIGSYMLYEQMYWNVPEAFKVVQRGEDSSPIYVPAARTIVETLHRYLANDMQVVVDPQFGTDQEKQLAAQVWTDFARREKVYSKFNAEKRYGIIRGDWCFYLRADPTRAPGTRISFQTLDPGGLFPIYLEDDLDVIIGWHYVEQYTHDDGKQYLKRTTWRKATGMGGPSAITVEVGVFEVDEWGGPGMDPETVKQISTEEDMPPVTLPGPIDALPIYNMRNFQQNGTIWGSSELRGLERMLAAINQSISDEELELVLNGLGVYATNAGAPINPETGEEMPWNLGPGRVVEVPMDSKFERVSGTTSIQPLQDHLQYLHDQLDQATGTSAVAKGRVDVSVAESGVAMIIELGPLLARVAEKEQGITDVLTNLLFDLGKWFVAYEGTALSSLMIPEGAVIGEAPTTGTRWIPKYGPKIPENRQQSFDNIMKMLEQKAIPVNVAWGMLRSLGYDLPEDAVLLQATAEAQALEADALSGRIGEEIEETDALLDEA